MEKERLYL